MYNVMLERFSSQIVAIMQAVATAVPGSVLIHCHAGKDRTGLVIALLLALAGVPGQAIAEDYAASHLYLRPLYDAALAEAAGDPQRQALLAHHLGAKAETMLATLIYLEEQHGGVEPYLLASGLTAAEIKQIRYRLCV
jgi:protein tyrosine/serine phosphatase